MIKKKILYFCCFVFFLNVYYFFISEKNKKKQKTINVNQSKQYRAPNSHPQNVLLILIVYSFVKYGSGGSILCR